MTDVLDVVGLAALIFAGFLLSPWIGFAVLGAGCLLLSYVITAKARKAAEGERARFERLRQ